MIFGSVDGFLRRKDWIIEGGRKINNNDMLMLTKVEQNSLIGAPGHYHILAIPHQPTNELASADSSRF
jgi:hypothetical protein